MLNFPVVVTFDQGEVFQVAKVDGKGSEAIQLPSEGRVDGFGIADSREYRLDIRGK